MRLPGALWDLDHKPDGRRYLGRLPPSVQPTGRLAAYGRAAGRQQRAGVEEQPDLWPQRWTSDPPVGTQVILGRDENGELECEVYLGGGLWS